MSEPTAYDADDAEEQAQVILARDVPHLLRAFETESLELKDAQRVQGSDGFQTKDNEPFFTICSEVGRLHLPVPAETLKMTIARLMDSIPDVISRNHKYYMEQAGVSEVGTAPKLIVLGKGPRWWTGQKGRLLEIEVWVDIAYKSPEKPA